MEIMISVGVLSGIILVLLQVMKSQSKTSIQSQVDADISQMKTEIQSILNTPAHCNANLKGRASGTTNFIPGQALQKCTLTATATCKTSQVMAAAPEAKFTVYAPASSWGPPSTPKYSDKVRVVGTTIIIDNTAVAGGNALKVLTPVKLIVTAQDRLPRIAGESTEKSTHVMNFYTTAIYDGTNVVGCPQSMNSTLAY